MTFLCVKQSQFERALEFLDQAKRLEPTNSMFTIEKAQFLAQTGRKQGALHLYESITEIGPYVSAHEIAVALCGRGFLLIEMGVLDGAESAFRESLKFEPDNAIARNEMQYIDHLRQGGESFSMNTVLAAGADASRCVVCEESYEKGIVVSVMGMPVSICRKCHRKLTKNAGSFEVDTSISNRKSFRPHRQIQHARIETPVAYFTTSLRSR